MERHFVLPIAIAAAVHAGLLLGFRPAHPSGADPEPRRLIAIIDRIPMPSSSDSSVDESAESSPILKDAVRPALPEPVPIEEPNRSAIKMPTASLDEHASVGKMNVEGFGGGAINFNNPGFANVVSAGMLDRAPRARLQARPDYPFAAKREGRAGEVVVEFTVDEEGRVIAPRVVRSTDRMFDESSLQAIAKWRFEPGKQNGQIVRFRMSVPVVFSLSNR